MIQHQARAQHSCIQHILKATKGSVVEMYSYKKGYQKVAPIIIRHSLVSLYPASDAT